MPQKSLRGGGNLALSLARLWWCAGSFAGSSMTRVAPARGGLVVMANAKKSIACTKEGTNRCGRVWSASLASLGRTAWAVRNSSAIQKIYAFSWWNFALPPGPKPTDTPVQSLVQSGEHTQLQQARLYACTAHKWSISLDGSSLAHARHRKRRRTSGFKARMATKNGRKVIKARRAKGRHSLCPASEGKSGGKK